MENNTTQSVQGIDSDTMYKATIEFRSIGEGMETFPTFTYSHSFPDDYEGPFPAAFLAVRDMAIFMSMMSQTNIPVSDDIDSLTEDDKAILAIESAKEKTLN